MTRSRSGERESARPRRRWPGYAAAAWGFVFAVPSFYWALGGTAGATTTISPSLVRLVEEGVTWFVVTLWITGVLKVVGGLLGLALARGPWGRRMSLLLQFAAWGAGVLLFWHGALFVVQGVLVETGSVVLAPDVLPVSRWYTYLWGPWFMAGGVLFAVAARARLSPPSGRRGEVAAGAAGGIGALVLSAGMLAAGVG
ncbi:DUF3995 domain-containing protein [Planomonospora sp. ID91781]|uniref:DUF3995 domain-containing protein n=1 Tax=Planomonospora sp. ID91781 TaxID=2738135 RepID=UPI0018C37CA2|nr:DUF3995 domain-containing protein [Planomonospora sp. ID91781]MBG0821131.1 DUF3995 domain-containing protein [Planomonospora sp. ID91781]